MIRYSLRDKVAPFLDLMARQKRESDRWGLLHISPTVGTQECPPVQEVLQFLEFYFNRPDVHVLIADDHTELIVLTPKTDVVMIKRCEKDFADHFASSPLKLETLGYDSTGLEVLTRMITPALPDVACPARILLTRLKRAGNCVMIVDDDQMVTRQLEKLLSTSAFVVCLNTTDEFTTRYNEYAPDILFLDIHLRGARGNELLRELRANIDPYAHVVMISSDTVQSMVMDIKDGGASGFIAKPFKRESVLQHLNRAPTFVPRYARP